jgi:monoamine oxidase
VLDAIVVGAGLSGLVCARRLVEAGARIAVIEARDRVGGRLCSGRVGGALVDLGGQWMTAGQPRLAALAAELGAVVEKHERSGTSLVEGRGGLLGAFAQWRAMRRIERLMKRMTPADTPPAAALDAQSLADFLARDIRHPVARERIGLHADLIFAADPASISLLYYLQTMRATAGFRPESADELRFRDGAQQLALRIGEQLGDRVHINEPVTAITQTEHSIAVNSYTARRAVLAIPPLLVRQLAIDLPPAARAYVDAAFAGRVIKCFAAYATPSWRERGLSGESYRPRGAVRATVEIVDSRGGPAVLLAFVVGVEAERWPSRTLDDRKAEVLAAFAHLTDDAPLDYLEVDWGAEPWSAGCVPCLPPGALTSGVRWRESIGRLHIAGTETAEHWPGYMEGAIEAGERAAREVLASG